MSKHTDKKFSMILTNKENQTFNAYRKVINPTMSKKNTSFLSRDLSNNSITTVYKEVKNSNFKSPFGRGEKRFVWQDNNNSNKYLNAMDLHGHSIIKKKTEDSFLGFHSFYDLNQELPIDKERKTVSVNTTKQRRFLENLNSTRVLNPDLDKTFGGHREDEVNRKKFLEYRKKERTGSIQLLIDKTPESQFKSGRKLYNRSFNLSINIFCDEYHNDCSPKPTAKKFVNHDMVNSNKDEPMAGVKTKYEIAEIYRRHLEPAIHSKKKLFFDKIQTIHGGSSAIMPLTNRNKTTQNATFEYDFVATTPQTRLSTINNSNANENPNRHRRNDSSNISSILEGKNTLSSKNIESNPKLVSSSNNLPTKNTQNDHTNNLRVHDERANRSFLF